MNAAETLVDHALGLRWSEIGEDARRAVKTFLHDSLCVGVAGRRAAHADAIMTIARGWGAGDEASVLGYPGLRLPASSAAFVNAFQIHGQEYDCVHEQAVLHPMATVLAALLAEVERDVAVSGEQFLTALIAGVDVAVTLGLAANGPLIFFRPATAGIFGCVAAIASLRAMKREQALDAFGHALAFASGTMQAHVEGKPALPVQVANAARNALVAIDLARAAMSGVRQPIEGAFAYFALFEKGDDLSSALALLGNGHRITGVSCKPFPTGRAAHGGIVAVQQLMLDHGITADNVISLEYRGPPLIKRLVGRAAFAGMEPGYARLCLPWLASVTLLRGTVTLADFRPDMISDPALLKLAGKIRISEDGNLDPATFVPAIAIANMVNGREVRQDISVQLGSPEWKLSTEQHLAKALACLKFGGLEATHEALWQTIGGLERSHDAAADIRASGVMG